MQARLLKFLGASAWRFHFERVRRDAALHGYVAAYWVVGLSVAVWTGVQDKFVPFMYASYSLPLAFFALVIGTGLWALRSPRPLGRIRYALGLAIQPEAVAVTLLFLSLSVHMGVFTSVKTMLTDIMPFHADRGLAALDEWLHGIAPWRVTTTLLPADSLPWIGRVYFGIWGLLLPGCLLACLLVPQLRHARDQYLWTHLVLWPLLGNMVAGAAMSAGPVFYGQATGDGLRFGELVAYLAHCEGLAQGAQYLWQAHASGGPSIIGGISAFPSMHLANATLFALLAARVDRRLMWAAIAFCGFILFGSIHLGWHYAVDGYFSIVATVLVWWVVGGIQRRISRQR